MNKYTELIENYLQGRMNADERKQFETRLSQESELKETFLLQQQIMKGIERAGIQSQLSSGLKKASFKSKLKTWTVAVLIIGLTVGIVLTVKNNVSTASRSYIGYEGYEANTKSWSDADRNIKPELFKVKGNRDTVIETKGGIIFTIPARAFLDTNGDEVLDGVDIEVKEALTASDIMLAGLSTTSNGDLLETGGMFYLNARKNGKNLVIANNKGIYTSIPNLQPDKDMQLFEGQRTKSGQINWVNPKAFEKKLKTLNILKLNFYPPNFLDSLKALGFNNKNKRLTDSIYYSFVCSQSDPIAIDPKKQVLYRPKKVWLNADGSEYKTRESSADSAPGKVADSGRSDCGIDPSRIHAIWDKKFNNTLLATKEFEQRLQAIFKTCDARVLDVYVANMNKKMYQADSMASRMLGESDQLASKPFWDFYLRKDGGVAVNDSYMQKLYAYMEEKQKEYQKAMIQSKRLLFEKEHIMDQKALEYRLEHNLLEAQRSEQTFSEELEINLDEAYRQLGKPRPRITPSPDNYLGTTLVNTGWYNVDKYVIQSTIQRKTLDYTDPETGKKAVIHYEPFVVNVANLNDFDRVYAYLIPNQLSSYQRLPAVNNGFKENLNELLGYKSLVIGFKGETLYGAEINSVKPGEITVRLEKMSKSILSQFDSGNNTALRHVMNDVDYQTFEQKETVRKTVIARREEIERRLWPLVFPCAIPAPAQYGETSLDDN